MPDYVIRPLAELEREAILSALTYLKGNKPAAAKALGISLNTLYNRLRQYRLRVVVELVQA